MDAETWTTSRRVDAIERELRDKNRRLSTSERRLRAVLLASSSFFLIAQLAR